MSPLLTNDGESRPIYLSNFLAHHELYKMNDGSGAWISREKSPISGSGCFAPPSRLKIIAIYGNIITAKLETSSDERIRSQLRERQRGPIDTP